MASGALTQTGLCAHAAGLRGVPGNGSLLLIAAGWTIGRLRAFAEEDLTQQRPKRQFQRVIPKTRKPFRSPSLPVGQNSATSSLLIARQDKQKSV
jgi:hypothetical protein